MKIIIDKLNQNIELYKLHPYIIHALNNTLTQNQLIRWIMCAGRESRTFPEIIKNMISWIDNEQIKNILIENLDDEYGNGNPNNAHFRHYIQLLNRMGFSENDFLNYQEKEGVKFAVSLAYNISVSKNTGLVLGYMLINEGLTPIVYSAIQEAMKKDYPTIETDFFAMHIEVDEHHVAELYKAINYLDKEEYDSLKFGIEIGLRGMQIILDESLGLFDNMKVIPELSLEL